MISFKRFFKSAWEIIKETKSNFTEGEPIIYSASIAFFTIFSLPAILIVTTLIGTAFFEEDEVQEQIVSQVEEAINPEAGEQIAVLLENAVNIPDGFIWIVIGILLIIKSATIIFFIMQKALNAVWNIQIKPKVKYVKVLKHRIITLAIVIGLGAILVLSIFLDLLFVIYNDNLQYLFEEYFPPFVNIIRNIFSIIVVFIFFTIIHKQLPDIKISWKDALVGSFVTSILFLIGKEIINYVLSNIKLIGIYATAGSLVILLLWVFYSSIILLVGAEFTKAYTTYERREIKPKSIAVKYQKKIHFET